MTREDAGKIESVAEPAFRRDLLDGVLREKQLLRCQENAALLDITDGTLADAFPEAMDEIVFAQTAERSERPVRQAGG